MIKLSEHARMRTQQRGGGLRFIALILDHADVDVPVGGNCRALSVRGRTAQRLNLDDRLHRYAVVVSDSTGDIVSFLFMRKGWRGTRYRRSWK